MKTSTIDLNEEIDTYDVENSLSVVAAVTGHSNLNSYKDIVSRKHNVSSLAAAKLLTNMINELSAIVSYTPAMIRPTVGGEGLRTSLTDCLDHLYVFRSMLVDSHNDDEGYSDVKVIKMEQEHYGKEDEEGQE